MLQRFVPLAIAFSLLVHALPAAAQTSRDTAAALADDSRLVVTGQVSSVETRADAGLIYTYATVQVMDVLKGELQTSTIVVKQLGGTLPTLGLHIADQAVLRPGEQALLFLAVRPRDGTLTTTGLSRGKWPLMIDLASGARTAVMDSQAVAVDASLRASIAGSRARTEAFVAVPPELAQAQADTLDRPAFGYIEGGPARWHDVDDGRTIPIDYQDATNVNILNIAIGAWNNAGSRLRMDRRHVGPAPGTGCQSFVGGESIRFYWNDPCNELPPGTFGVGGGFFTPGFQKTINGVTFDGFVQGLAIIDAGLPQLAAEGCLRDATIHVLGHAIGLGDGASGSVMQPALRNSCSTGTSGLTTDDLNGVRSIYPSFPGGGYPPQPPTAITATAVLDRVTLSWTPAATGGAATSYILQAGSQQGLADIASFEFAGTSAMVGAVPPGQYWVRVLARNILGTSAPSPDTQVIVGPCEAPGAPSPLSYTTADNIVTLNWGAPATGVAQGYLISAGFQPGQVDALGWTPLGPAPSFTAAVPYGHYYARVAARNSCATGPATADVLVSVLPCTAPPDAPTGLGFTLDAGNVVTLSWTAPSGANLPSSYDIIVGSQPGFADVLQVNTGSGATSFQAFAPPGRYYVRVGSRNHCTPPVPAATSNEVTIDVP